VAFPLSLDRVRAPRYAMCDMINRRSFLTAAAALPAFAKPKPKAFDKPLAVQLYTLRNQLPHDAATVIRTIAEIGYKEVEIIQADIPKLMPLIKENGLTAPSGHFDTGLITGKRAGATWQDAIEQAKANGIHFMVMPYLAPEERGDLDSYRALADKMNRAAEQCSQAGLEFCYHNHAFEFAGKTGERPWDVLLERWDPKLVGLEVDVFWVSVAGGIPSDFIRKQAGRVKLVHLKDKAFGTAVQYNERVPPSAFREVGTGVLDIPAILRACESAGVKHYIVEQDQTPGPPLESLRLSYTNLRKIKV
jgi:sugar phosphate isomerase/epimerase